jgi:hypothetical protein
MHRRNRSRNMSWVVCSAIGNTPPAFNKAGVPMRDSRIERSACSRDPAFEPELHGAQTDTNGDPLPFSHPTSLDNLTLIDSAHRKPDPPRHEVSPHSRASAKWLMNAVVATAAAMRINAAPTHE